MLNECQNSLKHESNDIYIIKFRLKRIKNKFTHKNNNELVTKFSSLILVSVNKMIKL